ncbi:MAG TPA: GNAT family N-acetyltransferase [Anaerolinea sp.]|nr:GNAT family N-acetyltransferase [Anaerolinea sp.]
MHLTAYPSAAQFLASARAVLEANEAANSLMYGLALRDEQFPERILTPHFYAAVEEDGALQALALMTPPNNLVVTAAGDQPSPLAFQALAEHLHRERWKVPGVIGPARAAQAFAEAWQARTGAPCRLSFHEGLYELRQVSPLPPAPGRMRQAEPDDLDLIAPWLVQFHRDALPDDIPTQEQARESTRIRITDGAFYLWEDPHPVALAGWTRPTPHGCSIGPVYTPAAFRRMGYGTALTAALSQVLLDSGKQFVALFTDLANPTSNSIYQKIGYRRLCDFDMIRFD